MHPNRAFRATDIELLANVDAIGLAHIFVTTAGGPMAVHAPLSRAKAAGNHELAAAIR